MLARYIKNACRAFNNTAQLLRRIQLQTEHDAEAVTQRTGHLTGTRSRADERKFRQVDTDRARRRPLADDDIECIVLHRGIENLLYRTVEAMNLVNKQNIIL